MMTQPSIIALSVLVGSLLAFEAYGIHRLRRPPSPTPESALDSVCQALLQTAQAKGLTGAAREIDRVTGPGPDPYFDSLAPFLNARLEHGFKQFLFSDEVRKKTVAEIGRLMKRREWTDTPAAMTATVPDVLLLAEWSSLSETEVGLTLRAARLGLNGDGVQAAVRFTPPRVLQEEARRREGWRLALCAAAAPLAAVTVLAVGRGFHSSRLGGSPNDPVL